MGKRLIAAASAVVGCAAFAHTAAANDWTQVYIGVGIGADVVSTEYDTSVLGLLNSGSDDVGTSGFGASLRLGADYQVNNWLVVGAFANIDWSNTETKIPFGGAGLGASPDLFGVEHAWTVGARAGALVTPDTLSYFLVGYTEAAFTDVTFGGLVDLKVPDGRGIVVGSGFEHRLTSNISLTGEYRASYLEGETLFSIPGAIDVTSDTVLHTGRVGLAYRFGGGGGDRAPYERLTSSWTGFYAGIGTGVSGLDGEINAYSPFFGSSSNEGMGGGDFGGSIMVGYDHRVAPSWLIGVFGAVDKTLQDSEIEVSAFGSTVGTVQLPQMDELYTVAARAGYLLASDTLVYGLVGYSWLDMSDLHIVSVGFPTDTLSIPSFGGVTVGGGVETLIGNNLSLRAEYRYAAMGEETLISTPIGTVTSEADVHTTRVFLNYRFD